MNRLNIAAQLWAKEKGLDTADPAMQILKIYEELAEMTQAYTRQQSEELLMELGDVYVTLAIFALQVGIEPTEALKTAYKKINGRKGKMIGNTFVKEGDYIEQADERSNRHDRGEARKVNSCRKGWDE